MLSGKQDVLETEDEVTSQERKGVKRSGQSQDLPPKKVGRCVLVTPVVRLPADTTQDTSTSNENNSAQNSSHRPDAPELFDPSLACTLPITLQAPKLTSIQKPFLSFGMSAAPLVQLLLAFSFLTQPSEATALRFPHRIEYTYFRATALANAIQRHVLRTSPTTRKTTRQVCSKNNRLLCPLCPRVCTDVSIPLEMVLSSPTQLRKREHDTFSPP